MRTDLLLISTKLPPIFLEVGISKHSFKQSLEKQKTKKNGKIFKMMKIQVCTC